MRSTFLLLLLPLVPTTVNAAEPCGGELAGRWSGCWADRNSGHQGPLKARFEACGPEGYRVVFTGRFFAVLPFRYAANLNVVGREGDKVLLAGESRVPLFGTFRYSAWADACNFEAEFCSRRYEGVFRLHRVP